MYLKYLTVCMFAPTGCCL